VPPEELNRLGKLTERVLSPLSWSDIGRSVIRRNRPAPAMASYVVGGSCGAGQDELASDPAVVNLVTDRVPQRGCQLPLVDQPWGGAFQHPAR